MVFRGYALSLCKYCDIFYSYAKITLDLELTPGYIIN